MTTGSIAAILLGDMTQWSVDIVRQSGWDLWVWICAAGSVVLVLHAVLGRVWETRRGIALLIAVGVGGTILVLLLPALHRPGVGLFWTFGLLSILSIVSYLNLRDRLNSGRLRLLLGMRIAALALLVPKSLRAMLTGK